MKPPTNLSGYDPTRNADAFRWDSKAAERVLRFFPACLHHIEGRVAGQPFEPNPWERDFLATVFGWKRKDGTRRYREFFIAVPRKNNKTTTMSGLILFLALADGEPGAQCYLAAGTKEQAALLHRPAAAMVARCPELAERCQIFKQDRRIVVSETDSFIRTLPAEVGQLHGLNAHAVVIDEIHVQPNRDLYDVLKTSTVARAQPLLGSITTAGHDRETICYELWEHSRKVRDGIIDDPYFLPVIYEATEDDDWTDREVWKRVNPNYGRSVPPEYLEEAFTRAQSSPSFENTFKNLHLNMWTESDTRWISSDAWNNLKCELPDLDGRSCVAGLDLASTDDLCALVYVFPIDGLFYALPRFWVPEETAGRTRKRYQSQYRAWINNGWLRTTPGEATDYEFIRQQILEDKKRFHIQEVIVDEWQALDTVQHLRSRGLNCVKCEQTHKGLWPGVKAVEESILAGRLRHDGNPCMSWQIASTVMEPDANNNRRPAKRKSEGEHGTKGKIDGVIALIMAMSRVWDADNVYDQRGVLTL